MCVRVISEKEPMIKLGKVSKATCGQLVPANKTTRTGEPGGTPLKQFV